MKIGDKVTCINDDFSQFENIHKLYTSLPKKGKKYIVRHFDKNNSRVLLEELRNPTAIIKGFPLEPGFGSSRFANQKDDSTIALAEELLLEVVEEYSDIEELELV